MQKEQIPAFVDFILSRFDFYLTVQYQFIFRFISTFQVLCDNRVLNTNHSISKPQFNFSPHFFFDSFSANSILFQHSISFSFCSTIQIHFDFIKQFSISLAIQFVLKFSCGIVVSDSSVYPYWSICFQCESSISIGQVGFHRRIYYVFGFWLRICFFFFKQYILGSSFQVRHR